MFKNFDDKIEKIRTKLTDATTKSRKLLTLTFNVETDIFSDETKGEFITQFVDLATLLGQSWFTVLRMELRREGLTTPSSPPKINPMTAQQTMTPPIIVQSAAQKGGGLWDYMGARKWSGSWDKYIKHIGQIMSQASIISGQKVFDLLEYGRQVFPQIRKTFMFFMKACDHIYFFPDESTKQRHRMELQLQVATICSICEGFGETLLEDREEKILDRKRDIGKAIIALKTMEYQSMGDLKTSEIYKALREASGPSEF